MPPQLPDDVVEEILARFPPDEPALLVRAALACKAWHRIVSGAGFRRRFRQFHRTPPVLGFLRNVGYGKEFARFVPTSTFRPRRADWGGWRATAASSSTDVARFVRATRFYPCRGERRDFRALDARHGRVLLASMPWEPGLKVQGLEVWDPVTDELWELPDVPHPHSPTSWNAAVVCGAHGVCDHLDCRRKPFLDVFLDSRPKKKMRLFVYSSEAGTWSEPTYGPPSPTNGVEMVPPALVGNALHFLIDATYIILKYDLATRTVSTIFLPDDFISDFAALTTTEDGRLGFARVEKRTAKDNRFTVTCIHDHWSMDRSIVLETLLNVDACSIRNDCVAFAHGVGVFFVGTDVEWFSIDLKSGRVRKENYGDGFNYGVVPYTSFYTPGIALLGP
ncbi:hypothetical protein HU200_013674 [Digitaria exilis]|uniref:F-box domain-containing protein n=1 Tax=Digitaria exilis TaxID=1010633 RepID=A0A835FE55_9POAL|nr:hypothetical protein HU200_013674 [Digitaria exilis]